jgi:hypothetical protein
MPKSSQHQGKAGNREGKTEQELEQSKGGYLQKQVNFLSFVRLELLMSMFVP